MTPRALAWLLLAPCCLLGQLRLFLLEGSHERLVLGTHDFGEVETGQALEAAFRIRNAGVAPARLETFQVAGTGFALTGNGQSSRALDPGATVDFTVRFEPRAPGPHSAFLTLNTQTVLLRAVALPSSVILIEQAGGRSVLSPSTPVDFGNVELDLSGARRFWLENPNAARLDVTVTVTGASFRGPEGIRPPISLGPGESVAFEVVFGPQQAGIQEGLLEVNRRSVRLRGTGVEPPFPKPLIFFDPPETASGRNVRLTVRLASPPRRSGSGEVQIEFQPALPGLPDDPAIVFLDVRSRSSPLSVLRGEEFVWFGPRQEVWLQTGTTAGRIVVTVHLGDHAERATLTIGPMPVVIDSLKVARGASSLEISLTGFDNTRTASRIVFSFFDAAGQLPAPGRIAMEAAGEFRKYFESSMLGGTFALRAAFPVTGDASGITEAEVEITNSAGVTRSQRVAIRP